MLIYVKKLSGNITETLSIVTPRLTLLVRNIGFQWDLSKLLLDISAYMSKC